MTNLFHLSHKLANGLWGIERDNIGLTTLRKISGIPTIKCLLEIGRKSIGTASQRSTTILIGVSLYNRIEPLAIGRCDILDIRHILQSAFYLKRAGTCFCQSQEVIALVHVFQGEQIALMFYLLVIGIDK